MNDYYFLLTIPVPNTIHWMQVGLEYKLPFHPNLTDEIQLMGFHSKINSIYYNLEDCHDGCFAIIELTAVDDLFSNQTNESAIGALKQEFKELQQHYPGIIFNDASVYSEIRGCERHE